MANLVIDIGNTLTKLAVFQNRELIAVRKSEQFSANDISDLIQQYLVDKAIISSVGRSELKFETASNELAVMFFNSRTESKINNKYKSPETLGPDRLAAVIGANYLYPGKNCLVIDAGTCITMDAVDGEANFFGGSISPGLNMRLKAMHSFTGKLPSLNPDTSYSDYHGSDTETCMLTGAMTGAFLEVEGLIQHYSNKYNNLQVLLCGGDAPYFDTRLKNSIFAAIVKFEPHLVMIGLNEVIHHNND